MQVLAGGPFSTALRGELIIMSRFERVVVGGIPAAESNSIVSMPWFITAIFTPRGREAQASAF